VTKPEPKLTWDDLTVGDLTPDEMNRWLPQWYWLVSGELAPIFLSRFGNWFLRRRDGSTDELDVCDGILTRIAATPAEFDAMVNTPEWQEQHLYSALVLKYRRQGIIARGRDAIAFVPHPIFAPSIDQCKVITLDMGAWQAICCQSLGPRAA
jgi:hypothetical protein